MLTLFIYYALGALIAWNLIAVWFHSNFPQHLWSALSGTKVYTKEELANASMSWGGFGDLWVCPLCIGTWISALVAGLVWLSATLGGLPAVLTLAAVFGWPVIAFRLEKLSEPGDRTPRKAEEKPPSAVAQPAAGKTAQPVLSAAEARIDQAFKELTGGKKSALWDGLFNILHNDPTHEMPLTRADFVLKHRSHLAATPPRERSKIIKSAMVKLLEREPNIQFGSPAQK